MTPINASVTAIRDLIKQDLLASNELAARITQLRQDTADGKPSSARSIAIMASSNKDRAREIGARIEDLVGRQDKTPTDRELLQALTARQAICDKQSMQLAELRDLEFEARGEREEAFSRPSEAHAEDLGKSQTATSAGPPGLSGASSLVDLRYAAKDHEDMGKAQDNHPDPQGEIGEEHASEKDPSEHQVDHTASWPLLYRILGVDPSTENDRFRPVCDHALKQLALKHSPKYFPNDPSAPERWQAVQKAYDTLSDPARKRFYDAQGRTPAELVDFDLSTLSFS